MTHRSIAFVSNRGGIGKSTLVCQLASALAKSNLLSTVVVVDFSIHRDTTTFFLGGYDEPKTHIPGVRSAGQEAYLNLSSVKNVASFVRAAINAHAPQQPRGFWSGYKTQANPPCKWQDHAVQPSAVNPAGECPPNVFLVPGPESNADIVYDDATRAAFTKTILQADAQNVLFIFDTDCEISERPLSSLAIASCTDYVLVTSDNWSDYIRLLEDQKNGVFQFLKSLTDQQPRLKLVIFNTVKKLKNNFVSLLNVADIVPFTPSTQSRATIAEIAAHLHDFLTGLRLIDEETAEHFVRTKVTCCMELPDILHESLRFGKPLCVSPYKNDAHASSGILLEHVASRIV